MSALAQRILDAIDKAAVCDGGGYNVNGLGLDSCLLNTHEVLAAIDAVLAEPKKRLPIIIVLAARCYECPLCNDEHRLCTHPSVGGNPRLGSGRDLGPPSTDRPSWCPLPQAPVLVEDGV